MSANGYRRPRSKAETVERRLARYPEARRMVEEGTAKPETVRVIRLFEEGYNGIEVAEITGWSTSYVYGLVTDPTGEQADKRRHKRHGTCRDCGAKTFNGGAVDVPERCVPCHRRDMHETSVAWLVAEVHHWNDLYGRPPAGTDWNLPSVHNRQILYAEGRANGRFADATVAELERRHREDGPWPTWSSVQGAFGGSWNGLIEAAGFEPLPVGKQHQFRKAVAA